MQDWATGVALNAPTMGLLGHTVYHGSPHKFDKFDASKIGTGEGAQAYGHGLYLAESPAVAQNYKNQLGKSQIDIGGKAMQPAEVSEQIWKASGNDSPDFLRGVMDAIHEMTATGKPPKAPVDLKAWTDYGPMAQREGYAHAAKALAAGKVSSGALYKVDLPDEWLPKMLDWDKPLSEQPEGVKAALRKSPFAPDESVWPHYTGRQLYEGEMNARGPYKADGWPTAAAATDVSGLLNKQGIPGIRYKDQGSRGKEGGTYNYVVFPGMEHLLKILERE
jgi:hypothetical protein